ncbi:hypothetical protein AYO20_02355 [Fonsecaea nubica]|uniref:Xylanolytic transcriptional activator regulatory domain-containing protein n=1 Tax=Fonsecaea nubica TaxID=856822 RepID=A0A178D970_9EURO|nr:hypothetical protein AYO20_02355 [Fonsecaea nubica]OAL38296.1 hypothetical protein AYO20_02355 [Fonsecaea nubica]
MSTRTPDDGNQSNTQIETGMDSPRTPDQVWTSPLDFVDGPPEPHVALTRRSPSQNEAYLSDQHRAGSVAPSNGDKRIVYADDTLTHCVLPHMTGHRSFNASDSREGDRVEPDSLNVARVTISCSQAPSLTWFRRELDPTTKTFSHLVAEDITYLCEVKGVLAFPPVITCDLLMGCFVRHFLPAYPVVDRNDLQRIYLRFRRGTISSPLLMHSIFFAACQYMDENTLQEAGFKKRSTAQEHFHTRAALLHSFNCEKDQLMLIQSLIFMSPRWTNYSEEKDIRFWTTCACNLAFTMGLHKAIPPSSRLSQHQRCLWRRIFWTLFWHLLTHHTAKVRDYNVALGIGRPPVINLEVVDVELLSESDFYETSAVEGAERSGECLVDFYFFSKVHSAFMTDLITLSKILSEIFTMNVEHRRHEDSLLPRLISVKTRLEQMDLASERATRSYTTADALVEYSIWPISVELNRQRIMALTFRVMHKVLLEHDSGFSNSLTVQQVRDGIIKCAARTMALYEELLSSDVLKYSHSFLNTSLFNALITYLEEVKDNPRDSSRACIAVNKIQLGLLILGEHRKYWNAARWSYSLFKFCVDRDFEFLQNLPRQSRWHSPDAGPTPVQGPSFSPPPTSTIEEPPCMADFNFGEIPIWDSSFVDSHWLAEWFPITLDQS